MFSASGDNHPGARRATPLESGWELLRAFSFLVASSSLLGVCAARALTFAFGARRFEWLLRHRRQGQWGGAIPPLHAGPENGNFSS